MNYRGIMGIRGETGLSEGVLKGYEREMGHWKNNGAIIWVSKGEMGKQVVRGGNRHIRRGTWGNGVFNGGMTKSSLLGGRTCIKRISEG